MSVFAIMIINTPTDAARAKSLRGVMLVRKLLIGGANRTDDGETGLDEVSAGLAPELRDDDNRDGRRYM